MNAPVRLTQHDAVPARGSTTPDGDLTTPLDKAVAISRRLIVSAEPAVVLTSLATACVPTFSDGCTIEVIENDRASYRICAPVTADRDTSDEASPAGRIMTVFEGASGDTAEPYRGVITHTWRARAATLIDVAVARILTDRALAGVARERLAERCDQAETNVATLRLALENSRQIGAAVGVLMATHKITDDEAFNWLKAASARRGRMLSDIAAHVVQTGRLDGD